MCNIKKVLIIGAGELGNNVLKNLIHNNDRKYTVFGFLDDDHSKKNLTYYGKPILGTLEQLPIVLTNFDIDMVIFAIARIPLETKKELLQVCSDNQVKVKQVPGIKELIRQSDSYSALEDVDPQDLLGRTSINLLSKELQDQIEDKIILITGAGGSIGSEICRQVLSLNPRKIILLGHGENSIHKLLFELSDSRLIPAIADIQDLDELYRVFDKYRPEIVYHAAAHKHVPLMESALTTAFKNNFLGTKNVADISEEFNVKSCVMISTDKAVKPVNNMGRTKRLAEMYMQYKAKKSMCNFSVVRFGNVLGSRGSVIPIFIKQLKEGLPITLTHRDMTRYFMTIPEAACLVLKAGSLAKNGYIYILDMGEPIKILDLAKNLIQLAGYTLDEVQIVETGIRPGEKLTEELFNELEIKKENVVSKIHVGKAIDFDEKSLLRLAEMGQDLSEDRLFLWIKEMTSVIENKSKVGIK